MLVALLRIKVKFRVSDGEVFVECPRSGEISAQAWCPFCKQKLIAGEETIQDLDERLLDSNM